MQGTEQLHDHHCPSEIKYYNVILNYELSWHGEYQRYQTLEEIRKNVLKY